MSHIGFNTSDYEPSQGGKKNIVPAGDYVMVITGDEFKQTKKGNGTGFLIDWQICEGQRTGDTLTCWINYENPSRQCEDIGRGEMRAIADACGIQNPRDTEKLYNIPMLVTLGVEYKKDPNTGEDIPENNIFIKWQKIGQQPASNSQQLDNQQSSAPVPAWQR